MRNVIRPFALILLAVNLSAQQVADTLYRFENVSPAYAAGAGPQVCIDEAHFNFHTAARRYKPFAELLRGDGYRVKGFPSAFSRETLSDCRVLLISNAAAEANSEDWPFPHPSAFSREEINEVVLWVRGGGSLFLIVDHAPMPGAAGDLATVLGVHMLDGYARSSADPDAPTGEVVFGAVHEEHWQEAAELFGIPYQHYRRIIANPGRLAPHPIVKGRSPEEEVDVVVTFTGHAFYPSENVEPILIFGPKAVSQISLEENFQEVRAQDEPKFSVGGWLQGAALRVGGGRVVILGEAAMCTAQIAGRNRSPFGMNAPQASQNAQFCLNAVHWLSGLFGNN